MNILFFDTETNGLPKERNALSHDHAKWPHIVHLAWQIWTYSDAGAGEASPVLVCKKSVLIRPEETLVWNAESEAIHGISKERALAEGKPVNTVLEEFRADAATCHVLIAHNIAFDKPVLRASYYRMDPSESFVWWPPTEYCTMENTKRLCKLPSKFAKPSDPYKYPRLVELQTYLHGSAGDFDFHTADGDVSCLVSCFQELVRRRLVPFDTWRRTLRVLTARPVVDL